MLAALRATMSDCRSTNAFFSALKEFEFGYPRTRFGDLRLKLCLELLLAQGNRAAPRLRPMQQAARQYHLGRRRDPVICILMVTKATSYGACNALRL